MKRLLVFATFLCMLLGAFELAGVLQLWPEVLLPRPSLVFTWLGGAIADGTLLGAALVTARRLFLGYLIGVALGVPLGLLASQVRLVENTLGVLALGMQTLPSVCWVPMALLWFGQTEGAMLFVVVMGTIWSILLATDAGVRGLPPIYARAARTMGSRGLHMALRVILPAAFPAILTGLKQGWAFAWRSLMAAEIFVTILTGFGLGQLLHYGRELHAMEQVLAVMAVIVLIGVVAEQLLFAPAERWLKLRWGLTG